MTASQKKLLDQVREVLRKKHYSLRTEESYIDWIIRYIRFHQLRHPRELGISEIEAFLSHLALDRHVAASTQNQARSALLFLYRQVLELPIDAVQDVVVAKTPTRLPVVLTRTEVYSVIRFPADRLSTDPRSGRAAGIISVRVACKRPWPQQYGRPRLPSRPAAIRFAIHSRPICSRTAMTSAPCRSCSGTPTCARL
jgi:site-specific recombinase XerD